MSNNRGRGHGFNNLKGRKNVEISPDTSSSLNMGEVYRRFGGTTTFNDVGVMIMCNERAQNQMEFGFLEFKSNIKSPYFRWVYEADGGYNKMLDGTFKIYNSNGVLVGESSHRTLGEDNYTYYWKINNSKIELSIRWNYSVFTQVLYDLRYMLDLHLGSSSTHNGYPQNQIPYPSEYSPNEPYSISFLTNIKNGINSHLTDASSHVAADTNIVEITEVKSIDDFISNVWHLYDSIIAHKDRHNLHLKEETNVYDGYFNTITADTLKISAFKHCEGKFIIDDPSYSYSIFPRHIGMPYGLFQEFKIRALSSNPPESDLPYRKLIIDSLQVNGLFNFDEASMNEGTLYFAIEDINYDTLFEIKENSDAYDYTIYDKQGVAVGEAVVNHIGCYLYQFVASKFLAHINSGKHYSNPAVPTLDLNPKSPTDFKSAIVALYSAFLEHVADENSHRAGAVSYLSMYIDDPIAETDDSLESLSVEISRHAMDFDMHTEMDYDNQAYLLENLWAKSDADDYYDGIYLIRTPEVLPPKMPIVSSDLLPDGSFIMTWKPDPSAELYEIYATSHNDSLLGSVNNSGQSEIQFNITYPMPFTYAENSINNGSEYYSLEANTLEEFSVIAKNQSGVQSDSYAIKAKPSYSIVGDVHKVFRNWKLHGLSAQTLDSKNTLYCKVLCSDTLMGIQIYSDAEMTKMVGEGTIPTLSGEITISGSVHGSVELSSPIFRTIGAIQLRLNEHNRWHNGTDSGLTEMGNTMMALIAESKGYTSTFVELREAFINMINLYNNHLANSNLHFGSTSAPFVWPIDTTMHQLAEATLNEITQAFTAFFAHYDNHAGNLSIHKSGSYRNDRFNNYCQVFCLDEYNTIKMRFTSKALLQS